MPTTIKLKNSVTTTNAPSSLAQGEVAINITDKKVWVGNAATTPIQLLGAGSSASFGALTCTSLTNSGLTSGRVTYATTAGLLTDSANLTFNGTTLTVADFTDSSLTANRVVYATTAGNLTTSAGLTFDGTTFATTGAANFATSSGNVGIGTSSPSQKLDVQGASGDVRVRVKSNGGGGGGLFVADGDGAGSFPGYQTAQSGTNYWTIGQRGDTNLYMNREAGSGRVIVPVGSFQVATTIGVGGATPSTSGAGITFPATQSASTDANTLDDYEEGTFTPVMTFGGAPAFSAVTANGKYTKVGNCVTFEIAFGAPTKTANTGGAQITGLPFAFSDLQKVYIAQGDGLTYTSGAFLFCYNAGSGTTLDPYQQAAGSASQFTNNSFGNGGTYRVCGSYFTT